MWNVKIRDFFTVGKCYVFWGREGKAFAQLQDLGEGEVDTIQMFVGGR